MENKLQIPKNITITSVETIKVLSDSTRLEIMKYVGEKNKRDELCTVKELAKLMDVSPTKLYYHIKQLEEKELLVVGNTRIVSGIIEKQYQVAAMNIALSQSALTAHEGPKDEALKELFNSIEQIIGGSIRNTQLSLETIYSEKVVEKEGGAPATEQVAMHIAKDDFLLTYPQAEKFKERLTQLTEEFQELSDQNIIGTKEKTLYFEFTQIFVPQYQRKDN